MWPKVAGLPGRPTRQYVPPSRPATASSEQFATHQERLAVFPATLASVLCLPAKDMNDGRLSLSQGAGRDGGASLCSPDHVPVGTDGGDRVVAALPAYRTVQHSPELVFDPGLKRHHLPRVDGCRAGNHGDASACADGSRGCKRVLTGGDGSYGPPGCDPRGQDDGGHRNLQQMLLR